jgi:hypothetical protein
MEDNYWGKCPYYESSDCPRSETVDRAYLIPQLLDTSEIEATEQICRECGKYLDDKRKYPRIRRPLRIALFQGHKTAIEGNIVNVSHGGALVELQRWADIDENERVVLNIYSSLPASEKSPASVLKLSAQVKRVDTERKQLAVTFLSEINS